MKWTDRQIIDLLQKASDSGVDIDLSDAQIAELIFFDKSPGSDIGMNIMKGVSKTISQHGDKKAPCRYKAFEKQFPEQKIEVHLFSNEGTLCGEDSLNCIYVFNGSLYSVPPSGGDFEAIRKKGVKAICLADCFASLAASAVESASSDYETIEMNKVSSFSEMNLRVPSFLKKFLEKKDLFLENEVNCQAEIRVV